MEKCMKCGIVLKPWEENLFGLPNFPSLCSECSPPEPQPEGTEEDYEGELIEQSIWRPCGNKHFETGTRENLGKVWTCHECGHVLKVEEVTFQLGEPHFAVCPECHGRGVYVVE